MRKHLFIIEIHKYYMLGWYFYSVFEYKKDAQKALKKDGCKYNKSYDIYFNTDTEMEYRIRKVELNKF